MKVLVDRKKCTLCSVCVDVCPFAAISVTETTIQISDECTLCGMCVDTCEFGALSLPEVGTGPAADLASYKGVWVFAEWREGTVHKVTHELLSTGRILADKLAVPLAAVLLGYELSDMVIKELIAYGADTVYVVDHPALAHFRDDAYAKAVVELIHRNKPEILLAGATTIGRSFIPRVAASLGTGLTADCTELDINDEGLLLQTRPAFGGNVMATIICPNRRPQMATVRPKVMKPAKRPGHRGEIVPVAVSEACLESRIEVPEVIPEKEPMPLSREAGDCRNRKTSHSSRKWPICSRPPWALPAAPSRKVGSLLPIRSGRPAARSPRRSIWRSGSPGRFSIWSGCRAPMSLWP